MLKLWMMWVLVGWFLPGCVRPVPPPPDGLVPGPLSRRVMAARSAAVMVAARESIQEWADERFSKNHDDADVDGGSAVPISPDGYFLTADHVLARLDGTHNAFVLYGLGRNLVTARARVVWRSSAADLALLHVPLATPDFYYWTPPARWLPEGTWVVHSGIATGRESGPGRLASSLAPEGRWTGSRRFKIDIQLKPGDSGGAVVDARGLLVGINSAVEFLVPMDTAFFVDSEGCRPNVRELESLIRKDRLRKNGTGGNVE